MARLPPGWEGQGVGRDAWALPRIYLVQAPASPIAFPASLSCFPVSSEGLDRSGQSSVSPQPQVGTREWDTWSSQHQIPDSAGPSLSRIVSPSEVASPRSPTHLTASAF